MADVVQQPQGATSIVTGWLAHPFQTNGSALNWFLFLGLVILACIFWGRVLADLREVIELA